MKSEKGNNMNHKQRVVLADAICAIRPDWTQGGVLAQLHVLDNNWTGNDAQLAAHAMGVASSPSALTPGAFSAQRPNTVPDPDPEEFKEPSCYTCGRRKSACQRQQDWEIMHGVPDPHVFETEEDAVANRAARTPEQRAAMSQLIRGFNIRRVNDEPGMAHAVESAKAAEELAAAQLKQDGLV